jgi:hypothetical protein
VHALVTVPRASHVLHTCAYVRIRQDECQVATWKVSCACASFVLELAFLPVPRRGRPATTWPGTVVVVTLAIYTCCGSLVKFFFTFAGSFATAPSMPSFLLEVSF